MATQPLPAAFWETTPLPAAITFADDRHLIIYGQRTADDRLVFGGRGAPYHWRSRVHPDFDRDDGVFAALRTTLVDLFPGLAGSGFTHAWGGPLAIPRDWHPSVGLDRATGLAWAGGYVGDGVAASNLAGRTLRDLLLGPTTRAATTTAATIALVDLPWVGHRSPRWEPEPLRWLAVNAGLHGMATADAEERLTRRTSLAATLMAPLVGH